MAKKEAKTDLWVARQLDDSQIKYDAQGSDVKEINEARVKPYKVLRSVVPEMLDTRNMLPLSRTLLLSLRTKPI